jgi:hypothetical protein
MGSGVGLYVEVWGLGFKGLQMNRGVSSIREFPIPVVGT